MAELVDALDLGSSAERRGGSSPLIRTNWVGLLAGEVAALNPLAVDAHALAHAVVAGGGGRRSAGDRGVTATGRDDRVAMAMMAPADDPWPRPRGHRVAMPVMAPANQARR